MSYPEGVIQGVNCWDSSFILVRVKGMGMSKNCLTKFVRIRVGFLNMIRLEREASRGSNGGCFLVTHRSIAPPRGQHLALPRDIQPASAASALS